MSSNQLTKSLNKCISKLCGNKHPINKDYECLPYEQEPKTQSPINALITQNINKLNHLNKLKKAPASSFNDFVRNEEPQFHSTQLDQSSVSFQRPEKVTSTFIHQTTVSNESFSTDPSLSQISDESSCFSTCSNSSENTESFQTLYTSNEITENDVYICNSAYNAKFKGDISVKYTERVYLIHASDDFALVKKINDSQCGYIPVKYLTTLPDFFNKF